MTEEQTVERLNAFGRRCLIGGAVLFAVIDMAARLTGWGVLLTVPAGYAGGWLACRVIDRMANRAAEVEL